MNAPVNQNAPATLLPNAYSLQAIINEAVAVARNETTGNNAKLDLLSSMAIAAKQQLVKEGDVKSIFEAYLTEKNERALDKAAITGKAKTTQKIGENYAAKTISEWKQVVKCGALVNVDGVDTLSITKRVAVELGLHVYDAIINIARKQIAKGDDQFDYDVIKAALQPTEDKPEHTEMKALKAIIKSIEKMINGAEESDNNNARPAFPSEAASSALKTLEERLAAITPAADATVAFLKQQGYSDAVIKAMMTKV